MRLASCGVDIDIMKYIPSGETIRKRCTTVKAWELPKQKSALAPEHVWTNEDMDPVKIENQTWTIWTWMAYVISVDLLDDGIFRVITDFVF